MKALSCISTQQWQTVKLADTAREPAAGAARSCGTASPRDIDAHIARRYPAGSLLSPYNFKKDRQISPSGLLCVIPLVCPCEPLCAILLAKASVYPPQSLETNVAAFMPEVLKAMRPMCWKRWYDCIFCAFRSFSEDEKESRIKGWRRNRRSARSLLPAVRAVDGGFNAGGCGAFYGKFQNGWRLCSRKRRRFNENKRALRQIGGNDEQK